MASILLFDNPGITAVTAGLVRGEQQLVAGCAQGFPVVFTPDHSRSCIDFKLDGVGDRVVVNELQFNEYPALTVVSESNPFYVDGVMDTVRIKHNGLAVVAGILVRHSDITQLMRFVQDRFPEDLIEQTLTIIEGVESQIKSPG